MMEYKEDVDLDSTLDIQAIYDYFVQETLTSDRDDLAHLAVEDQYSLKSLVDEIEELESKNEDTTEISTQLSQFKIYVGIS